MYIDFAQARDDSLKKDEAWVVEKSEETIVEDTVEADIKTED